LSGTVKASLWLGTESPTDADMKSFVMRMREKRLKPSGGNCRIRAVNAFLNGSGSNLLLG